MLVLGQVQRALGLEYGEQGLGTGGVALLGQIKGDTRLFHFLVLPAALALHAGDGVQGFLHIREPGQDAGAVQLQQLLLFGTGHVPGGTQPTVVEDRRGEPGGEGVVGAVEDIGHGPGATAQVRAQYQARQHRRPSYLDIGAGRRQACLGGGDVRAAAEQFAGHAAADGWPLHVADGFVGGGQRLHRIAQQGGKDDAVVLTALFEQW